LNVFSVLNLLLIFRVRSASMILSISRKLLRPVCGISRQVLNSKKSVALPTNSAKYLWSSSSSLLKDKSDEGNPFSVDDMYLSSSKTNLDDFDVPDPIEQKNKLPENLNDGEIILTNAKKNLEDFNIPDPVQQSKEILNNVAFNSVASSGENVDKEEEGFMNDDDIAGEILDVALEFVHTHGWTQKTIDVAVEALELSPSTSGMFKRGPADLVLHFIESSNAKLFEILAAESKRFDSSTSNVTTSDFIEKAIKERLKMIIPFIDSWPQALTLLATPSVAAEVLEQGANMVDEIWYHAGDMSSDMNWYTKRAAVAALHLSAELFLLQDKSVDYADTWEFLHRRVRDVETAASAKNSIDHALHDALNMAGAGFTTVQNILGLNNRSR